MSSVASTSSTPTSANRALIALLPPTNHQQQNNHINNDYKSGSSAGLPQTKSENADGRKQLGNGMYRQHRIMSDDEVAAGKGTRWLELEIHGKHCAIMDCIHKILEVN
jgi:hypothetical protein